MDVDEMFLGLSILVGLGILLAGLAMVLVWSLGVRIEALERKERRLWEQVQGIVREAQAGELQR